MIPIARKLATLALCCTALASCSIFGDRRPPPACPRVAVLSDAGSLTRFAPGAGHDILDIDFEAQFGDLAAECRFRDGDKGRSVIVSLVPVFVIDRGAANTDRTAQFTYFVSVVRNEEIRSKELFPTTAEIPANRSRTIVHDSDDPIVITIPLPWRDAQVEDEVIVGFQLTPDELAYNQNRRLTRQ